MSILCYHAVEDGWTSPLAVAPREFRAQCRWLAAKRAVVPLAEAVERLDRRGRLRGRTAAVTFDDGFRSVHEHAMPELVRHGLPATVFVVTGTLTGDRPEVDWVDTPPSTALHTLDAVQLLELEQAGVSVASHSHAHHILPTLSDLECERDLRRSREVLEDLLGRRVPFLAYPRGAHDARVRASAQRAGYSHAFALPEGPEPYGPFAVPRVGIFPGNGTRGLAIKTRRWYLPLRMSRAYPQVRRLVRGSRPPTRRLG